MLKDRRKPWQKTANVKWSRCGHMLQENPATTPSTRGQISQREFEALYSEAWARAWNKPRHEFQSVVIHSAGIADDATREKNRREGRKILNRIRAQIDRRMIGGPGPNASRNPEHAIKAYAEALGITATAAAARVSAQYRHLAEVLPIVSYRPDATERLAQLAQAA